MNKTIMNNFIIKYFTSVFVLASVAMSGTVYAQEALSVEFERQPLFSEAQILPGDEVTRFIKVSNNSGTEQAVLLEAINTFDDEGLGSKMNLLVRRSGEPLYQATLAEFFEAGAIELDTLSDGDMAQYDLTVSLVNDGANQYQGASLGFDILIGFSGGQLVGSNTAGGSGGGYSGLQISNEAIVSVNSQLGQATLAWTTNYPATSQVIYGPVGGAPYQLDLNAANFGYPKATVENFAKVKSHSVTIDNLTPGQTYVYRAVSHASPATVGFEKSFTMPTNYVQSNNVLAYHDNLIEGQLSLDGRGQVSAEDRADRDATPAGLTQDNQGSSGPAGDSGYNLALVGGLGIPGWLWWLMALILVVYISYKIFQKPQRLT